MFQELYGIALILTNNEISIIKLKISNYLKKIINAFRYFLKIPLSV